MWDTYLEKTADGSWPTISAGEERLLRFQHDAAIRN